MPNFEARSPYTATVKQDTYLRNLPQNETSCGRVTLIKAGRELPIEGMYSAGDFLFFALACPGFAGFDAWWGIAADFDVKENNY